MYGNNCHVPTRLLSACPEPTSKQGKAGGRQGEGRKRAGERKGECRGEGSGRQGKASHFAQEESPTRCCTDHMYLVVA